MSCNKYNREKCIATGETIAGHKRRYCPKCRAVYQKQYRERIMSMVREQRITQYSEDTVKNG